MCRASIFDEFEFRYNRLAAAADDIRGTSVELLSIRSMRGETVSSATWRVGYFRAHCQVAKVAPVLLLSRM